LTDKKIDVRPVINERFSMSTNPATSKQQQQQQQQRRNFQGQMRPIQTIAAAGAALVQAVPQLPTGLAQRRNVPIMRLPFMR